jgi:hypothetical protein
MSFVKNLTEFDTGVDLFIKKVEAMPVRAFRWLVWEIFCEILNQTPQWSGKAVANWNIGVGAPDYTWDDSLGEPDVGLTALHASPLEKGNPEWIEVAKLRNIDKLSQIKRREKVYITNSVFGDTDHGKAGPFYMAALQDPSYWQHKLREVNKPYEVATETMIRVIGETQIKGFGSGLELSRVGGLSFGDGL